MTHNCWVHLKVVVRECSNTWSLLGLPLKAKMDGTIWAKIKDTNYQRSIFLFFIFLNTKIEKWKRKSASEVTRKDWRHHICIENKTKTKQIPAAASWRDNQNMFLLHQKQMTEDREFKMFHQIDKDNRQWQWKILITGLFGSHWSPYHFAFLPYALLCFHIMKCQAFRCCHCHRYR